MEGVLCRCLRRSLLGAGVRREASTTVRLSVPAPPLPASGHLSGHLSGHHPCIAVGTIRALQWARPGHLSGHDPSTSVGMTRAPQWPRPGHLSGHDHTLSPDSQATHCLPNHRAPQPTKTLLTSALVYSERYLQAGITHRTTEVGDTSLILLPAPHTARLLRHKAQAGPHNGRPSGKGALQQCTSSGKGVECAQLGTMVTPRAAEAHQCGEVGQPQHAPLNLSALVNPASRRRRATGPAPEPAPPGACVPLGATYT